MYLYLMKMARIFLLLALLGSSAFCIAQKTEEDEYATDASKKKEPKKVVPFKDRLVYGGNFGGYFGTFSYFQINPMVGYKTTNWWVNGVGVNYIYSGGRGINQSIYGASLWSRAYVYKSLMLHSEFEMLSLDAKNSYGQRFHDTVPVWLVGGGFQNNSGGIGLSVLFLYDLIQDPNSPYSSPVFRIGGLIGF